MRPPAWLRATGLLRVPGPCIPRLCLPGLVRIACTLLLPGSLLAQPEEHAFVDSFWKVEYRAPALRTTLGSGDPAELLRGRVAGDVQVAVLVHEGTEEATAEAWRKRFRAEWEKKRRRIENVEEADGRLFFEEPKLGVFRAHHAHAFVARGLHCFEVHAWVDDRTETSSADLKRALDGLEVGPDPGCGLAAVRAARRAALEPTDARPLLEAGLEYLGLGTQAGARLAAGVLARARSTAKEGALKPEERWKLLRYGGEALLAAGRAAEAAEWLEKAEGSAAPAEAPGAAYALARALAAAGKLDAAFAALDRAFAGPAAPVDKARLSRERDLGPLRKDPRWEEFWKRRVAGR